MSNADTIELNGKLYDIRSGELAFQPDTIQVEPLKNADDVEGEFIAHQKDLPPSISEQDIHIYHSDDIGSAVKVRHIGKDHSVASHASHHKRQRANTLLRSAVKKPSLAAHKQAIKAQGLIDTRGLHKDVSTPRVVNHTSARLSRAQNVQRSQMVSKFHDVTAPRHHSVTHIPVQHQVEVTHHEHAHRSSESLHQPSPLSQLPSKTVPKQSVGQRSAQWAIVIAIVAIISGIVLYIDRPQIGIGLASYHANVAASYPSYTPNGYSLQLPVQSSTSQVVMTYTNGASSYKIAQSNSKWNNTDLLNNYVQKQNYSYNAVTQNGVVTYIFPNSSAVWVSRGILYQLSANNPLKAQDIVQIANSF